MEFITFEGLKFFNYIFSLYILCLSVLPCADRAECNVFEKDKAVSSTEHSDHNLEDEQCSPFCICSCCGVTMNMPKVLACIAPHSLAPTELNSFLPNPSIEEITSAIWQPPKIG